MESGQHGMGMRLTPTMLVVGLPLGVVMMVIETKIVVILIKEILKHVEIEVEFESARVSSPGVEEGVVREGRALLLRAVRTKHVVVVPLVRVR